MQMQFCLASVKRRLHELPVKVALSFWVDDKEAITDTLSLKMKRTRPWLRSESGERERRGGYWTKPHRDVAASPRCRREIVLQHGGSTQDSSNWIACLTYKSKAAYNPSVSDLEELVHKARQRNRSVGVTGMLLYENGKFLQTLEGPPEGLKLIWSAIQEDKRHSHIEVLSEHVVSSRLFSDWDLLLYSRAEDRPRKSGLAESEARDLWEHVPRMAQLALDGDDVRLGAQLAAFAEDGWSGEALLARLIEPTARAMGDAWLADECCEIDLTIGLSMLQLAAHAVRSSPTTGAIRNSRFSILLATAPGEPHMLGTSMLADQFTDAGWRVEMAFPKSDAELINQLRAQAPDAVDLTLSDALPRHHALVRLRETIAHSRKAAPENLAVISVGGRLFAEAAVTAASVGADYARPTVIGSTLRLSQLVQQRREGRESDR
jgi:methanogenic corrinoid protein MtbC1